jgi:hypothetical protein
VLKRRGMGVGAVTKCCESGIGDVGSVVHRFGFGFYESDCLTERLDCSNGLLYLIDYV